MINAYEMMIETLMKLNLVLLKLENLFCFIHLMFQFSNLQTLKTAQGD